jgi:hypothetical protein
MARTRNFSFRSRFHYPSHKQMINPRTLARIIHNPRTAITEEYSSKFEHSEFMEISVTAALGRMGLELLKAMNPKATPKNEEPSQIRQLRSLQTRALKSVIRELAGLDYL